MVLGANSRKRKIFTKNFCKKAQGAASAAVLVAIIGALLVSYVILVTPEERAELLGEEVDSGDDGGSSSASETLLEEFPGKIEYIDEDEIEHSLASIHIYTDEETQILTERSSALVKQSAFSGEDAVVSFSLDAPELIDNVYLSFQVSESSGVLTATLNGETLLKEELDSSDSVSMEVPSELLAEDNELIFTVSGPGAVFWRSNLVSLSSIKVVADVLDISNREASSVFSISDTEYENMESAVFSFQPDCSSSTSGKLQIVLNSEYSLYSASPDCNSAMGDVELDKSMLVSGQNTLEFSTDTGDYLIYNLEVLTTLMDVDYPTYYFQLSYEEEQSVLDGDNIVEVTLNFADSSATKKGYVIVNGDKQYFDTTSSSYSYDASESIVNGNNAISIEPTRTIEVRELIVEFQ